MTSGEQLTLLPAASLASLSVWPGSRQAQQMTVTSGRRLLASLPSCDRELWWLKTLVASSAWHSTMCLLTWKHKVTPAGRSYYQLQVSAPPIEETECGLWPTPRAARAGRDCRVYPNSGNHGDLEQEVAKMLPTPRAEGFDAGAHRGKPDSLHSYVKMLPTPTCQAAKHSEPTDYESLTREVMYPTPNAAKAGNDLTLTCSGDGRERPNKLGWAVAAMLPTPDAGMVSGGRTLPPGTSATGVTPDGKKRQVGLTNAVKMWRSPSAGDGDKHTVQGGPARIAQNGARQISLSNQVGGTLDDPRGMKLNPAWVSRMQGFPDNWMELE